MRRVLRVLLIEATLPVLLIAAWWLISASHHSLYVPSLHAIVDEIGTSSFLHQITSAFGSSAENFVIGIVIATVLGVAAGLVLGSVRLLQEAFFPLLEFWRAVPAVAILPMVILFFGIGTEMKVTVIVLGTIWPILLNTIDATRGVEPMIHETSRSYRLRLRDRIFRVILPAVTPAVLSGIRISLSMGVALIVISEMVGSSSGIGYFILNAQRTYAFTAMWGGTVILGIVGYLVNLSFRKIERSLLGRHGAAIGGGQ